MPDTALPSPPLLRRVPSPAEGGGEGAYFETFRVAESARWGDAVIARRDVPTSHPLAVVVDEARQGVTHVTRGRDLFQATGVHRLLQVLLGLPEPTYWHHRLLTDADGRKLSKSGGDTGLAELRASGATPAAIRRRLGR